MAKETEVFTYRVTPLGDGSYYGVRKFNSDGGEEETLLQQFMSSPDAEKFARSLVTGSDVVVVDRINNINTDSNKHVVLETTEDETDRFAGMAVKYTNNSVVDGDNNFRPTDNTPTPAQKAVDAAMVAPTDAEVVATDAEQKAIDSAAAKADKEEKAAA